MLSSRNKIIILIAGAFILFALLVLTIFDLWPSGKEEPESEPGPDLSFLEEEPKAEGLVFDSGNKDEFAAFGGVVENGEISPQERAARDLAELFLARSGTYSTDARFAYIEDLKGYMTDSLYSWFLRQKAKQPERKGFLTVVTEIAGSQTKSFTPSRARFELLTRVSETSVSGTQTYEQKAEAELVKDGNDWKVNGVFWGER